MPVEEPMPWSKETDVPTPRAPRVDAPDATDILKKMKLVNPRNVEKYRQRTGE